MAAALGTIAVVCSNRIDQALLPITAPSHELGFYAVAVTVAEVPLVCAALAARNALTLAGSGFRLRFVLREILPFAFAGIILLIALFFGAPYYTPLLFGSDFQSSVFSIQILLIGTAFSFVAFVSIALVSGRGRPGISSIIPVSSLLITCISFAAIGNGMNSMTAALISTAAQVTAAGVGSSMVLFLYRRRAPAASGPGVAGDRIDAGSS
jgi:O-antigen/teichoic acid export membrane protein